MRRPSRSRALLLTAVALPLLAGCGGGDDPVAGTAAGDAASPAASAAAAGAASSGGVDPCGLLTVAEVSAAVGGQVGEGERSTPTSGDPLGTVSCQWSTSALPLRTFSLGVVTDDTITNDGYTVAKLYDDTLTTLGAGGKLTPVTGIGDKAAFGAGTAFVLKGSTYLSTSTFGSSSTSEQALRTLTGAAAAKV